MIDKISEITSLLYIVWIISGLMLISLYANVGICTWILFNYSKGGKE